MLQLQIAEREINREWQSGMKKKICLVLMMIGMSLGMMACGGPSVEKIEQAQSKYNELVEAHNKMVDAHKEIADSYLDQDLQVLAQQVTAMKDYNLVEMTEEEIDIIIEEMSSTLEKYEESIVLLVEKKQEEADAELVEIPLTLHNQTGTELKELYLFAQGEEENKNILDGSLSINTGEILTGLYIYKDIAAKPWELVLADDSGKTWEIEISTADLNESGAVFFLQYNSENDAVILGNNNSDSNLLENSLDNSEEEL